MYCKLRYILPCFTYSCVWRTAEQQHTQTEQSVGNYLVDVKFLIYLNTGNLACSRIKKEYVEYLHEPRSSRRLFGRLSKIRSSGWGLSKSKYTKVSSGRVLNDFEYTNDRIFFLNLFTMENLKHIQKQRLVKKQKQKHTPIVIIQLHQLSAFINFVSYVFPTTPISKIFKINSLFMFHYI